MSKFDCNVVYGGFWNIGQSSVFLIAICFFSHGQVTLQKALSVCRPVRPSVGPSVQDDRVEKCEIAHLLTFKEMLLLNWGVEQG